MTPEMDLTLCIYYLNPQAKYLLSSSTPPHKILEWRGPGPQPTEGELLTAWTIISDPDWIDPQHPDHDWLIWKRDTLTGTPPLSHTDLWNVVKLMLERIP